MADFNWCHGPKCHTKHTVDRVRGVKGSKVLRTRKIKENNWNRNNLFGPIFVVKVVIQILCMQYWEEQVIALHPRTEALETPINVSKETVDTPYWGRRVETEKRG